MNFVTRAVFVAVLLTAGLAAIPAQAASEEELMQRVDQLARELETLKSELAAMKSQQAKAAAAAAVAAVKAEAKTEPATVLTSYGEINLNIPVNDSSSTQLDVRRFVLGFQHRFNPKTKLVTEVEVEHAVSSRGDAGEVAIEQAYFEREINSSLALRGGLMLMPLGFLNETHEPTAFYGVERNFVETAIIPSTLREAGVQTVLTFGQGFTAQAGVVTGPKISNWDFAGADGQESPLGSIHQEGQLASARDPSFVGALNWRGIPGLLVGAAAIGGNATHGTPNFPTAGYLLWDAHVRYAPGRWQLSALYARGSFDNTRELNTPNISMPTLIPEHFDGTLFEAAYRLWRQDDLRLEPFARWEQFNTGAAYEVPAGFTRAPLATRRVITAGASLFFGDGLVVKSDYQIFQGDSKINRINLGLGWSF